VICSLSGVIAGFGACAVEVDVAGVGYLINVPVSMLAELRIGEKVTIPTHLVVREDSMTLYGFADGRQRELFLSLTGVTGVGPKLAMSVLGAFTPEAFGRALASGDVAALTSVSGLGKRGAERILLELKDKLGSVATGLQAQSKLAEVRDALVGLGYAAGELREVLDRLAVRSGGQDSVETMIRQALKDLATT